MNNPPVVRRGPGRPPLNRNKQGSNVGSTATPQQWNNANSRMSPGSSFQRPPMATNRMSGSPAADQGGYVPPHLHPAYKGRGRPPLALGRRNPVGTGPPPTNSSSKPSGYVSAQQRQQQNHTQSYAALQQQLQQHPQNAQRSSPYQQPTPSHLSAQSHPRPGNAPPATSYMPSLPQNQFNAAPKEPSYLSSGPTNRLLLSIKSGLPAHVTWALSRLTIVSVQNADAFVLDAFPGMMEALVRFPKLLISALRGDEAEKWDPELFEQDERSFDGMGYPYREGSSEQGHGSESESDGDERDEAQYNAPPTRSTARSVFQPHSIASHKRLLDNAVSAMLILRNASLHERNERTFLHFARSLNALVADILMLPTSLVESASAREWNELAAMHELRIYALDLLELTRTRLHIRKRTMLKFDTFGLPVAPPDPADYVEVPLQVNASAQASSDAFKDTLPPPAVSKTAQISNQAFSWLVWLLHTTTDRTMLISSLRCLGALAAEEKNESAFIEVDVKAVDGGWTTSPGIVRKCVSLLPLTHDAALLESALDCLYQTINVADNALRLGMPETAAKVGTDNTSTSDISNKGGQAGDEGLGKSFEKDARSIVRFLARDLIYGRVVWDRFHQLQLHPMLHHYVPSAVAKRKKERNELARQARRDEKPKGTHEKEARQRRLTKEEWTLVKDLAEPERFKAWMRLIYEAEEEGEVLQMELWNTYSYQFGAYSQLGGPQLLAPAEVIRQGTSVFRGATATSLPGDIYLVRGIRPRLQLHLRRFQCRWKGCASPETDTLTAVEAHVRDHTRSSNDDACRWASCTYVVPQNGTDVSEHLHMHVRTHLPESDEEIAGRLGRMHWEQRQRELQWKGTLKSQKLVKTEMGNGARFINGPTALVPFSAVGNEWRRIEAERQEDEHRKEMNLPSRGSIDAPDILGFSVTRTPMDPQSGRPTGIASTAALLLRCLARASANVLVKAGEERLRLRQGAEADEETNGDVTTTADERFGLPLPSIKADTDGNGAGEGIESGSGQGKWTVQAAIQITDSLLDVEADLIQIASENDILCPILNDTLADLRPEVGQSIRKLPPRDEENDTLMRGAGDTTAEDEEMDADGEEEDVPIVAVG